SVFALRKVGVHIDTAAVKMQQTSQARQVRKNFRCGRKQTIAAAERLDLKPLVLRAPNEVLRHSEFETGAAPDLSQCKIGVLRLERPMSETIKIFLGPPLIGTFQGEFGFGRRYGPLDVELLIMSQGPPRQECQRLLLCGLDCICRADAKSGLFAH